MRKNQEIQQSGETYCLVHDLWWKGRAKLGLLLSRKRGKIEIFIKNPAGCLVRSDLGYKKDALDVLGFGNAGFVFNNRNRKTTKPYLDSINLPRFILQHFTCYFKHF